MQWRYNKYELNKSKVIWEKAKSLFVSILQILAAIYHSTFSLKRLTPNLPFSWKGHKNNLFNVLLDATSVSVKWHRNSSEGLS